MFSRHSLQPTTQQNASNRPSKTYARLVRAQALAREYRVGFTEHRRKSARATCDPDSFTLALALLVCEADDTTEDAQREGAADSGVAVAKQKILELVEGAGILDDHLTLLLEGLHEYANLETKICTARIPLTTAAIWHANRLRSNDLRLATECLYRIHDVRPRPSMLAIRELPMLLAEIRDDLRTHDADRAANAFNTLTLYEELYGPDGKAELDNVVRRYMYSLLDQLNIASRHDLADVIVYLRPSLRRLPLDRLRPVTPTGLLRITAKYLATRA